MTIIDAVRSQAACLFTQQTYYMDIKPGNILYSITDDGSYTLWTIYFFLRRRRCTEETERNAEARAAHRGSPSGDQHLQERRRKKGKKKAEKEKKGGGELNTSPVRMSIHLVT